MTTKAAHEITRHSIIVLGDAAYLVLDARQIDADRVSFNIRHIINGEFHNNVPAYNYDRIKYLGSAGPSA